VLAASIQEVPGLDPRTPTILREVLCGFFTQCVQAAGVILPLIRPWLFPSISCPSHYSHIIVLFGALLCKLLTLSLNKCIPFSCCWGTTAVRTSSDWSSKSSKKPCAMTHLKLLLPTCKRVWISPQKLLHKLLFPPPIYKLKLSCFGCFVRFVAFCVSLIRKQCGYC
jgi:hypothetical protein